MRQCYGMIRISGPGWFICGCGLIAPHIPIGAVSTGEQFQIRTGRAIFNERNKLVRLSTVFTLHAAEEIYLRAPGLQSSVGVTFDPKEKNLCYVPEIETDTTTIRHAIFANLFPNKVCFVFKPPCLHDF